MKDAIPGDCVFVVVSYGNPYDPRIVDDLGIECAFAWKVLHSFFKSHYQFLDFMQDKSPLNRSHLSLSVLLSTVYANWLKKDSNNQSKKLNIFIGVDEYQKLTKDDLDRLIKLIDAQQGGARNQNFTFYCMIAGYCICFTYCFIFLLLGLMLEKRELGEVLYEFQ